MIGREARVWTAATVAAVGAALAVMGWSARRRRQLPTGPEPTQQEEFDTPLGPGRTHVPPGHHYSPIPSSADVERALGQVADAGSLPGIDLAMDDQWALVRAWQDSYDELVTFLSAPNGRFSFDNTWFTYADALTYGLMLRHLQPRRVIEVGVGHSSALALDVSEQFLDTMPDFSFIDPDPVRVSELLTEDDLRGRLRVTAVQDVGPEEFEQLQAGDILFVDSSHVLKAGSDVQFLLNEVLPRLLPGVHIHFHDVFAGFEYPRSWLQRGTAMNEAYAVRNLLTGGDRYRVVLFHPELTRADPGWFLEHMPLWLAGDFPIGGIWLTRC